GGAGIITNALIERNVIYGNGVGGGSGINLDGVQQSVIRNNLLHDNHASGISLYRIDAAAGSSHDLVINNTIVNAAEAAGAGTSRPIRASNAVIRARRVARTRAPTACSASARRRSPCAVMGSSAAAKSATRATLARTPVRSARTAGASTRPRARAASP